MLHTFDFPACRELLPAMEGADSAVAASPVTDPTGAFSLDRCVDPVAEDARTRAASLEERLLMIASSSGTPADGTPTVLSLAIPRGLCVSPPSGSSWADSLTVGCGCCSVPSSVLESALGLLPPISVAAR